MIPAPPLDEASMGGRARALSRRAAGPMATFNPGASFEAELELLIRARYPILYVVASEEMRVQNLVLEIAKRRQKKVFEWSFSTGIVPAGTSIQSQRSRNTGTKEPLAALDQVIEQIEPAIFIFKDLHPFLGKTNFAVIRKLKEIAIYLKNSFKTILLLSPIVEIPPEL